ncbi:MAG: hypothetical protein K9W44_06300 [Candidatus Lokiarchaeota archaeon]|nr:hypothetical protein [Candidatus Harpocratesius repetitus]
MQNSSKQKSNRSFSNNTQNIVLKIFNPSKWERTAIVQCVIPWDGELKNLQVYTENNEEITAQIQEQSPNRWLFRFVAENIPPLSTINYIIKPMDRSAIFLPPDEGLLDGNDYYLENDIMRVVLEEEGYITIMHREDKSDDSESGEKIYAMGEELTEGSIWAGESFYNFLQMNQFSINSMEIREFNDSKLIEASDFVGKIEVKYKYQNTNESIIPIKMQFSIQKGESPYVNFVFTIPEEILVNSFKFTVLNPIPFTACEYLLKENYAIFWNKDLQRGLLFLHENIEKVIDLSKINSENTTNSRVIFNVERDFFKTLNDNFSYALIPLKPEDFDDGIPSEDVIQKLVFDFYHPFIVEI